MILCVRKRIL